jgi:hypothetical protein
MLWYCDAWRRRGLIEATLLQTVTRGVVAALSKPTLSTLSTNQSPATTRLQSTSIRTVDGRGSALPAPDQPEIRAYFTGVGLFSYFSQSGFGQPLLFQYRILGQLLLSSTQGQLAFVSSSVIFLSHRRLTDWCRIWDYLMYGTALHTVITCATAPHSCNAQGCIRSATTQLSNVICGTDSPCRGRQ